MIHLPNNEVCPSDSRVGEQGYLLLGLLFLFIIILIGLALAAPRVAKQIQREKEVETVHRGEEYKRAIQLYYRKVGSYPTTVSQLKETNQVRFLRQDYVDPMTGKKDWKLLHLGQVQMMTLGFFGQLVQAGGTMPVPGMPGANGAATGMSGSGGIGGSAIGGSTGTFGSSSGPGSSPSMGGGGLNSSSNGGSSIFGDSSNPGNEASGDEPNGEATPGVNGQHAAASPADQADDTSPGDSVSDENSGGIGGGNSSPGSPMSNGPGGMNSGGIFGSSNSQGSGTFGGGNGSSVPGLPGSTAAGGGLNGAGGAGGPIVGVTVPLKKASILVYRKKKVYDKWQFVYNPQEEITSSIGQGGQVPGGGIGTPAGISSPGSNGAGSSPFGSSSPGLGSSPGGLGSSSGGLGSSSTGSGSTSSDSNSSSDNSSSNSSTSPNSSNPF